MLWLTVFITSSFVPSYQPEMDFKGFGAVAIIILAIISKTFQSILNMPFFKYLGKISFTLYLSHQLILTWLGESFVEFLKHKLKSEHSSLFEFVIFIPITFLFGHYLEKYVDSPGKEFTHKLNQNMKKGNPDSQNMVSFLRQNKFMRGILAS